MSRSAAHKWCPPPLKFELTSMVPVSDDLDLHSACLSATVDGRCSLSRAPVDLSGQR
jgi:hypothetical protein